MTTITEDSEEQSDDEDPKYQRQKRFNFTNGKKQYVKRTDIGFTLRITNTEVEKQKQVIQKLEENHLKDSIK